MSFNRSKQFHFNNNCRFCKASDHSIDNCHILASAECNYCHENGHTTKRCPKLSDKKKRHSRNLQKIDKDGFTMVNTKSYKKVSVEPKYKTEQRFSSLKDFPLRKEDGLKERNNHLGRWVTKFDISAKPVSKPVAKPIAAEPLKKNGETAVSSKPVILPKLMRRKKIVSWADQADEDSDDE